MLLIGARDVDRALDMKSLVSALGEAFAGHIVQPVRHHHVIESPAGADKTLLLMPAWTDVATPRSERDGYIGIKIVMVAPDNHRFAMPSVTGSYLLMSGATGEVLAVIDGPALTAWRTAAASALAARHLARAEASRHLVIGAGAMAPFLARAMRAVRPIVATTVWARDETKALAVVQELRMAGFAAEVASDLDAAVADADIVSAATLSKDPLVHGAHLRPGTHVDLVGAFNAQMRESDDAAVSCASVFVDTRAGALKEGGDLVQAIASGAFHPEDVVADLHDLARGTHPGRRDEAEITLFKSVGAALEDLAAAVLIYERTCADRS